jgi:hypothetical protein
MNDIDEHAAAESERQREIRVRHLIYVCALAFALFVTAGLPLFVIWSHL